MSGCAKEFAKFFAGIAAEETLVHWWLGIWGRDFLPMKFSWFTFTEQWNYGFMAVWPAVLAMLVYYAWIRSAGLPAPPAAIR